MENCNDSAGDISKILIYDIRDFKEDAYGRLEFKRKYGKKQRLPLYILGNDDHKINPDERLNITI